MYIFNNGRVWNMIDHLPKRKSVEKEDLRARM